VPPWLIRLLDALERSGADGVLGPVHPRFESEPPAWVRKGRFFERPTHATGFEMPWRECRTGNVLVRRRVWEGRGAPFRAEFGTGSEDVDFFRRMIGEGRRFIWCNEAVVHETVSPGRCTRAFMLKRALLRGQNAWRNPRARWRSVAKSALAVPLYAAALPVLLLAGQHRFMKYAVKCCDHLGKLLAAVGVCVVREREM
jgi:GT2 family glycosyltransferase